MWQKYTNAMNKIAPKTLVKKKVKLSICILSTKNIYQICAKRLTIANLCVNIFIG